MNIQKTGRALRWPAVFAVGLSLCAVACVGPAKNFSVYEAKAVNSAESAQAAVETVKFAIQLALTNRAFGPFQSVTVEDAEEDVGTAQGHFDSIQPPDAQSDQLRQQTDDLLSKAIEDVGEARIAMRRGDIQALRGLLADLEKDSDQLDRFVDEHL
ncbi:MAG TPA: hypothetical protein VF660_03830 [Actinomycetota bacterium]